MTSKHTPGPWHLDETFVDGQWGNPSHWVCEIVGPDNSRIVADIPEYRTYEEDAAELEANARLVAASPELYAAVASVIDATRDYLPPDGITKDEFISRVIAATDNARMAEIMK